MAPFLLAVVLLLCQQQAADATPSHGSTCISALTSECGAVLAKCTSFPCATCESCIILNAAALGKAGCTPTQETGYCAKAPPKPPPSPPPPPSPKTPCDKALSNVCGASLARCGSWPCASCQMCVITNQTALGKAGCTAAEEEAYCASPLPPAPTPCTHTDSRGDSYDLSSVPNIDQIGQVKGESGRPDSKAWYHIGVCSPPTQSADPTKGCPPPCSKECGYPPYDHGCSSCNHGLSRSNVKIDLGGEATCQFDIDQANNNHILYNAGLLSTGMQKWGDGPSPGRSVTLTYEDGSSRGGCGNDQRNRRSTELVVTCDPCSTHNISKVTEPETCHYRVEISSYAGCATNKPPPSASCPHVCDRSTFTCKPVSAGTPGANATLGDCTKACHRAPPPPPPPPLSKNPCIRFGHTIPVPNHVDVEITQAGPPAINHTWTNFKFSDFSDWVNVFKPGTGTITIWENVGGKRGAQVYQLEHIPLTPGPLVVVIKVAASQVKNSSGFWPPALPDAVETIAASYVDTDPSSKVRLFNLGPGTVSAGMTLAGKTIATNVAYGLGSSWVNVPTVPSAFGFVDEISKKALATKTVTPAGAPIGNTEVLLGLQSGGGADFGMQVVSLVDAPEGGTCHP
eukprot:COSAG05_NODE_3_length_51333_cov_129.132080_24_plen_626_part_00